MLLECGWVPMLYWIPMLHRLSMACRNSRLVIRNMGSSRDLENRLRVLPDSCTARLLTAGREQEQAAKQRAGRR